MLVSVVWTVNVAINGFLTDVPVRIIREFKLESSADLFWTPPLFQFIRDKFIDVLVFQRVFCLPCVLFSPLKITLRMEEFVINSLPCIPLQLSPNC